MTDQTPIGAPHADDLTTDDYARFLQGGEAPTTLEVVTTADKVHGGDLLLTVDGIQLGHNGLLVEGAEKLSDPTGEYLGVPMWIVTVWGARRMIEMRVEKDAPVAIRRGLPR